MSSTATAPTSWQLTKIVALAMQTVESLRTDHGLILDSEADVLAALADEGVDLGTIIKALTRAALDSKAMGIAADQRIADLRQRRERFQRAETQYRATVQQVLEALALRKFTAEDFTLSLSAAQAKVIVTDETALSDDLVTVVTTRTPNKALIKSALEAGVEVEGAVLSNATSVLTVRSR
jgi:hypothetical protein